MGTSLVAHVEDILKLCRVKKGEKVIIVTAHEYNETYVAALMDALSNLEVEGMHIALNAKGSGTTLKIPATAWAYRIFKTADMIISPTLREVREQPVPRAIPYYCDEFSDLMASGVRMLDISLPIPLQRQMFPTEERTKRCFAGAEILDKATTIRITSNAGTDVTMDKSGRPGNAEVGFADVPGCWDNFGWGCVSTFPLENSANGILIVEPGDAIPSLNMWVQDSLKITFEDGYITKIEGGAEAEMLRRYFDNLNDKECLGTSHIGFGLHEKTAWTHIGSHTHSAYGCILFAFGWSYGMGSKLVRYFSGLGQRKARGHTHIAVFKQNFYADDKLLVKEGLVVHPECKLPGK